MFVAYVRDGRQGRQVNGDGVLLGSYLNLASACAMRQVSGDLVFNDDGSINQTQDWLFPWERLDENCYAKRQQRAGLNVANYAWHLPIKD